jgi:phosphoribosylanthranilate isomerase
MQRTRIKICGLTRQPDVHAAIEAGADALGFVFYAKSPRCIAPSLVKEITKGLAPFATKVGLFVNATQKEVLDTTEAAGINLIQFHGDESPEFCEQTARLAGLPYLRALGVTSDRTSAQLLHLAKQFHQASAVLFDTASAAYGGSGQTFDWSILEQCNADAAGPPVVLSGGLSALNVAEAIMRLRPYAVDVSSGVELEKGIKDASKIKAFCAAVRAADAVITNA